jgi:hypothetical protein
VRTFLATHARVTFPPSTLFSSLMTWQIMLRPGDSTDGSDLSSKLVSLDVVEEDVTRSSRSVYCEHCCVVGESLSLFKFQKVSTFYLLPLDMVHA